MLLSGPQCRSQFCHSALSACPLSVSMADQYVGHSRIPECKENSLQLMRTLRCFVRFSVHEIFLLPNSQSIQKSFHNNFYKRFFLFLVSVRLFFFSAMYIIMFRLNFGQLCVGIQIPQLVSCMTTPGMTVVVSLRDIFVLPTQ